MRYATNAITKCNDTMTMRSNSNCKPMGYSYEDILNPATNKTTQERFIIHDSRGRRM